MTLKAFASRIILPFVIAVFNGGCASTWSTSDVQGGKPAVEATKAAAVPVNSIVISEGDVTDRKYTSMGDITVAVNKMTVFNADPTREQVNEKLREEAAKLGADGVLFVRYGTVGISMMSWGTLEGKGRAIKFVP